MVTATLSAPARADEPGSQPTAAALAISATVGAGPFLVGEQVPVDVKITNTGDTDATGVTASAYSTSGSSFFTQFSEWGDLAPWPGPGATLAAGQERALTVRGVFSQWSGAPVVRFYLQQSGVGSAAVSVPITLRDPGSASDVVAGLVYGDRDGDGTPGAGEGLAGVQVEVSMTGSPWLRLEARTDAGGRFRFADLPVRVYSLSIPDAPDGWVVEPSYSQVAVDGAGSAANVLLRGRRPLTDVLSAAMRFTRTEYRVGDRAEIEVTLTNTGATDLTAISAACDRSGGEGPELRDVVMGDLAWDAEGVTVPAGQSLVRTISGSVSEETAEYGGVAYDCDFGPREDFSNGRPRAAALAKVPGPAVTVRMSFHHDRDGDRIGEPDEVVAGARIVLRDAVTRGVVAQGRTDAQGRGRFDNVPSGPYEVQLLSSWKFAQGHNGGLFAGTCRNCQAERSFFLVPGPDPTNVRFPGW
ncbi:hypothetical protein ACIQMJ_04365 [Actinosynnema sp. NPDC091369]